MKKYLLAVTLFGILSIHIAANAVNVGDPAPDLTATNQENETVDLGVTFKNGISMVFFYPKADTPGCTKQACSMRDSFEELQSKGVKVFGVSYDTPEEQKSFVEKFSLPFDLIADQDKAVSTAFDRAEWSRQAYLINDGVVIWKDLQASTETQAADVKKALMELGLLTFASMES